MKLTVGLEPTLAEMEVSVLAPRLDEEVKRIETAVREASSLTRVVGSSRGRTALLGIDEVMRFFTENKKVFAHTAEGTWQVKYRMRELEESLLAGSFVLVNQGEIVNLHFVIRLDLSLAGTIGMQLRDGTRCFVSRRNLARVKRALQL